MPDTEGCVHIQVRSAVERLEGAKFCFSCQRKRPLHDRKLKAWRCLDCLEKKRIINEQK